MKRLIILLLCLGLLVSCAERSVYDTNVSIESKFTAMVKEYALWKAAAPPEVQQRWRKTIDPMIVRGDQLMDSYNKVLANGGDGTAIAGQIDLLITQILIEIAKDGGAK